MKKLGVILINQQKNKVRTLKKIWVEATLKKSQVAPYKNLVRFYRAPFKSLLRLQIKRVIVCKAVSKTDIVLVPTLK